MTGDERPPWVWDELSPPAVHDRWRELLTWVEWLEQAYEPWLVLPPCWPAHEGLRHELVLFWYWHGWLTSAATDPVAGLRWHADLRRSAEAWRELASCDHQQPGPEYRRILDARRQVRDRFVTQLLRDEL